METPNQGLAARVYHQQIAKIRLQATVDSDRLATIAHRFAIDP